MLFGQEKGAPCPVDEEARKWIEWRMQWLVEQYGKSKLDSVRVILPAHEFFPDPFAGTERDAGVILDRICSYMGIQKETIDLLFYDHRVPAQEGPWGHGTAGLYEEVDGRFRIWVEYENLREPLQLVATLAHELGHIHLLGHRRITRETDDHELLTDLITVFLGMGVLTANAVIRENYWHAGQMSGWSMGRLGYLSMDMFGYALAVFAWLRKEDKPAWASSLRLDVRTAFKKGRRFLAEHGLTKPPTKEQYPPIQLPAAEKESSTS